MREENNPGGEQRRRRKRFWIRLSVAIGIICLAGLGFGLFFLVKAMTDKNTTNSDNGHNNSSCTVSCEATRISGTGYSTDCQYTKHDAKCIVECKDDFIGIFQTFLCQNGKWEGEAPTCTKKSVEEIVVTFPAIDFYACCGTNDKKKTFLEKCNEQNVPAVCTDVKKGSAVITFQGDLTKVKENIKKDNFPKITVDGRRLI